MFKIRFKSPTPWKISITQQFKKTALDKLKMPRLQDMDGNGYGCENKFCYIKCKQVQNKSINDICNIKLGKKYLFKTVQSPSTQSEHINRYSFGFSGFSLWLLRKKIRKQRVTCMVCFGSMTVHSPLL